MVFLSVQFGRLAPVKSQWKELVHTYLLAGLGSPGSKRRALARPLFDYTQGARDSILEGQKGNVSAARPGHRAMHVPTKEIPFLTMVVSRVDLGGVALQHYKCGRVYVSMYCGIIVISGINLFNCRGLLLSLSLLSCLCCSASARNYYIVT